LESENCWVAAHSAQIFHFVTKKSVSTIKIKKNIYVKERSSCKRYMITGKF